jgi:hypothetical protein
MKKPKTPKNKIIPPKIVIDTVWDVLQQFTSKKNAIGRAVLLYTVNAKLHGKAFVDDRAIRRSIEYLRGNVEGGAMICARMGKGGGYWVAQSEEELDKYLSADERRALTTLARCRIQRYNAKIKANPAIANEMKSQQEMFPISSFPESFTAG